jgi:hypothetical protein
MAAHMSNMNSTTTPLSSGMWQGEIAGRSSAPRSAWGPHVALPHSDSPFSILLNGAMDGIRALRSAQPNIAQIYSDVNAFVDRAEEMNNARHPAPQHLTKTVQESILGAFDSFHDVPGTFGADRLHKYMFQILKTLLKKVLPFFDMANSDDGRVAVKDIVESVREQLNTEFGSAVTQGERDDGIVNVGLYENGNQPASAPPAA